MPNIGMQGDRPEIISIVADELCARIDPFGAQMVALDHSDAGALLWNGDPEFWTGRAPILFPIIGCLNGGHYLHNGKLYTMPKHGFARHSQFEVIRKETSRVTLALERGQESAAIYPFQFRLEIDFAIVDGVLSTSAKIINNDTKPMPASFGFHPALRWPLPFGGAREDHTVVFEYPQPQPIRRINIDGLLLPETQPSPVTGDTLHPTDEVFAPDAVIFDEVAGDSVLFGVPGRQRLKVEFADFPMLGIWTKPGAPFLCIEPWQGLADPVGFVEDIIQKPGIAIIVPGTSKELTMRISVVAP